MNAEARVLATKALDEFDHVRAKARDDILRVLTATPEPAGNQERQATSPDQDVRVLTGGGPRRMTSSQKYRRVTQRVGSSSEFWMTGWRTNDGRHAAFELSWRRSSAWWTGVGSPPSVDPPDEQELLDLLAEKARQGNVAAIRSLLAVRR
jgi:hypothetical protein